MTDLVWPILLTCAPAIVSACAFAKARKEAKAGQLQQPASVMLTIVFAIALYPAIVLLYGVLKSKPDLPPWEDPTTLSLGMLFLLAPVGIALTVVAGKNGASNWVVIPQCLVMTLLFLVGLLAAASV